MKRAVALRRNDRYLNGLKSLQVKLGKHGLALRDRVAGVNFFSRITADEQGSLDFVISNSQPGDAVTPATPTPVEVLVRPPGP